MNLGEAAELARTLLQEHKLDEQGWTFLFSSENKTFGRCNYRKRVVSLSANLTLLNVRAEVEDTIRHEIAHALTPGHGHNRVWKDKCREVGARPERLYDAAKVVVPKPLYEAYCESCGHTWPRRRKTKKRLACAKCCNQYAGGKFDERFLAKIRRVKIDSEEVSE